MGSGTTTLLLVGLGVVGAAPLLLAVAWVLQQRAERGKATRLGRLWRGLSGAERALAGVAAAGLLVGAVLLFTATRPPHVDAEHNEEHPAPAPAGAPLPAPQP
jgi:hypothetical protein